MTADMIAKWERGVKRPSPRYRQLLAGVFRVDLDELGLVPTEAQAAQRSDSLLAMLDDATRLLNKLGNAGRALRPHVFEALADDVLTRRSVLAMLDHGPVPPKPAPASAADLEAVADQCEDAQGSVPPAALLAAVSAQLRAATAAVDTGQSTGARQRILRARARLAILAGTLSAHDEIDNLMAARAYFAQALDDAHELDDHTLSATVLGHAAELAIRQSQPAAARAHLRAAASLAVSDPAVSTWLDALQARHGDHEAA